MNRPNQGANYILLSAACAAAGAGWSSGHSSRALIVCVTALAEAGILVLWLHQRLREARLALQRAMRAKSDFLSTVSHELRTPLNGIHGLSQVLAAECETAEGRRLAAAIQTSSRALMMTVDKILDFARIERGELSVQRAPFDVRATVEDIAGAVAPLAEEKGIEFQAQVDADVPPLIVGDAQRLREVLGYLLDNAIKFTEAGHVRLEAGLGGDPVECRAILFRVRDTGSGMPRERAASFFTAFVRADTGSARAHGGLGLGLTLAHRLVGLMGGSMGVESQPGKGSVFWFVLPTRAVDAPGMEAAPGIRRHPERVLVVDDNPINQLVAVRALHSLGYAGDAVASGEAALDAISRTRYDAVLMDCQMPGVDGFQAAGEIRRREAADRTARLPIIAMTADGLGSDRQRCLASGMDDYIAKPFRVAELGRALERWTAAAGGVSKAG